jgi:arginase family enzyme
VIGFDAHLDMRENYGGRVNSGSSYRRMLEEMDGRLRAANLVEIGINGWFAAKAYADYARKSGATVFTGDDVYSRGIADIMEEAIARATDGTDAVYVNFDVDVWDQPYAPGKVMRNPGGLTARDGFYAARRLGRTRAVRLFALNEVNPERDLAGFTALNGASVLAYFWAGMAQRPR